MGNTKRQPVARRNNSVTSRTLAPVITGSELAAMRHAVGLSQAELAAQLGYSHRTGRVYISQMERGICPVPRVRYPRIIEVLLAAKHEHDALTNLLAQFRTA